METIWAIPIGEDRYVLDNSPFCAYSVSWKDTVHAPHVEEEGLPTFVRILSKSGHRTVRVIFDPPVAEGNASDRVLKGLLKLGCTYEAAHRGYMAIDLAPEVSLEAVRQYLIEQGAHWEHADPTYEELYPEAR